MDIIDSFTKKQEPSPEDGFLNLKFSLEKLLEPLNLDQASLDNVVLSAIPQGFMGANGPTGAPSPVVSLGNNGGYQIVNGPDGEQYYVDNTGLFINVKDTDGPPNQNVAPFEEIVEVSFTHNIPSQESGVFCEWDENHTKILVDVKIPEGLQIERINKKHIFEYFSLLDVNSFKLREVCEVQYDTNKIPTCVFYTAKENTVRFEPSPHYKFNRPSKYRASCSNELLAKNSSNSNPLCTYDKNFGQSVHCPMYSESPWETRFLTNEKNIVVQSRRYNFGQLNWRIINTETQEVIGMEEYNQQNPEATFSTLIDSFSDQIGELTPHLVENNLQPPKDKVYTQHVANI